MNGKVVRAIVNIFALGLFLAGSARAQQAGTEELQQKVAAVKQAAAANLQALRQYRWIETTQISMKGEVKSTKQNSCLYGNDGKVQKTAIGSAPAPEQSGGKGGRLKQKIVEKKKEELTDYMEQVKGLIDLYVPPDPNRIQMAHQAGNISLSSAPSSGTVSLVIKNYAQPNDSLSLSFVVATNKIAGVNVNTYLNDPKDVVTLSVTFASLPDGTSYPSQTVLVATAKQIQVTTTNGNYQKLGAP